MIIRIKLITYISMEFFVEKLLNAVSEFQEMGLKVDIQYSMSREYHSALVIARDK